MKDSICLGILINFNIFEEVTFKMKNFWLLTACSFIGGHLHPGGKGGRCVGLTTLPPSYANCLEMWEP